uniref:LOW QUALITY PROTEIN: cell wall integrity protein scw1 n=1 Tax=Erigeron canadensis TaxID=72917 RepID=UPI001CB9BCE8|nr:LOW QUALITY PROTEIN: cell wall integrity protein scw1 [Erigeron canadensis]
MAGNGMHHQYHPHQWPPGGAGPAVVAPQSPMMDKGGGGEEVVRTIFITGLPEDVKEREVANLLRWLPGYEASQVNFKQQQLPMGFALFSSPHFAVAARDALQDLLFDADSNSVLHTEMAKKNLFVKRGIVADPNSASSFDQSKRMRTGGDYTFSPFHPPPVWAPHGYMAPPPPPYDPYAGYPVSQVPMAPPPLPPPPVVPAPSTYMPVQNTKDNPPCNTLFIGNLGEKINEEELRGIFSLQPGFKQMKVLRQERHTVCFIEFEDVNSATNVHHSLQGAVIPSSGSIGMRIQYSKNPFGRRKDAGYPGSNGSMSAISYQ